MPHRKAKKNRRDISPAAAEEEDGGVGTTAAGPGSLLPELKLHKGGAAIRHRVGFFPAKVAPHSSPERAKVITTTTAVSARNTNEDLAALAETTSLGRKYGAGDAVNAIPPQEQQHAQTARASVPSKGVGQGEPQEGGGALKVPIVLQQQAHQEGAAGGQLVTYQLRRDVGTAIEQHDVHQQKHQQHPGEQFALALDHKKQSSNALLAAEAPGSPHYSRIANPRCSASHGAFGQSSTSSGKPIKIRSSRGGGGGDGDHHEQHEEETISTWPSGGIGGLKPTLLQHLEDYIHEQMTILHHTQGQDRETVSAMRAETMKYVIDLLGKHFRTYREIFHFLWDTLDGITSLFDFHKEQIDSYRRAEVESEARFAQALEAKDKDLQKLKEEIELLNDVAQRFGPLEEDRKVLRALAEESQRQVARQKSHIDSLNERLDVLSRQHVTGSSADTPMKVREERVSKGDDNAAPLSRGHSTYVSKKAGSGGAAGGGAGMNKLLGSLEDRILVPCGISPDVPRFLQTPSDNYRLRLKATTLTTLLDYIDGAYQFIAENYIGLPKESLSVSGALQQHLDKIEANRLERIAALKKESTATTVIGTASGSPTNQTTILSLAFDDAPASTAAPPPPLSFAEGFYRWLCSAFPVANESLRSPTTATASSPTAATGAKDSTRGTSSGTAAAAGGPTPKKSRRGSVSGIAATEIKEEAAFDPPQCSLDVAYSIVYLAQHTYASNIYCRFFLYHLSGEVPLTSFLHCRLHLRRTLHLFESCDVHGIGVADAREVLQQKAKQELSYLSEHDRKTLLEAAFLQRFSPAEGVSAMAVYEGMGEHPTAPYGDGNPSKTKDDDAPLVPSPPAAAGRSSSRKTAQQNGSKKGGKPAAGGSTAALIASNTPFLVHYSLLFNRDHRFTQLFTTQFLSSLLYNNRSIHRSLHDYEGEESLPLQTLQKALCAADTQWVADDARGYLGVCVGLSDPRLARAFGVAATTASKPQQQQQGSGSEGPQTAQPTISAKTKFKLSVVKQRIDSVFVKRSTPMNVGLFNLDTANPPLFAQLQLTTAEALAATAEKADEQTSAGGAGETGPSREATGATGTQPTAPTTTKGKRGAVPAKKQSQSIAKKRGGVWRQQQSKEQRAGHCSRWRQR